MKHRRASLPSKLLSLDLLKPFALEKGEWYERILAHRINCQRAIGPPVQQKGEATTKGVYGWACRMSTADLGFPQLSSDTWAPRVREVRCRKCASDSGN